MFGRYLDGEPISYMDFPFPVPVCPSNGFVMDKEEYTAEELAAREKIISGEAYQNIFKEKQTSFYLLAKMLNELKPEAETQWWSLLQATWEADKCGDQERYKRYAGEAIEAGKAYLSTIKSDHNSFWQLQYIIPDLMRRSGRFDEAQEWVKQINAPLPEDAKQKDYINLALKLLQKAVDDRSVAQVPIEDPEKRKKKN